MVDGEYAYWGGDSSSIGKINLDGSGAEKILVQKGTMEFSYDAVLAGNTMFWGNDWHDTGLRGCVLPDCSGGPQSLVAGSSNVLSLAYDSKGKTLFWDQSDGIWRRTLPGAATENFIALQSKQIFNMTTDGLFLYWSEYDRAAKLSAIFKSPVGVANATALALGRVGIEGIAAYGNTLYFIEDGTSNSVEIRSVPLPNGVGAGTPTLIAPAGERATSLVADTSGIYWTSNEAGGDSIKMCPLKGCDGAPTIVAPTVKPWGIAADSKAVY